MAIAEEKYTVSRLTRVLRRLIEDGIPTVWIVGEISNYTHHRSGHRYFTLKDETAQLPCVLWRTRARPSFDLENGRQILAFGKVSVYEQGGRYQLDVQSVLSAGVGGLQEAFEELKSRLNAEGLFDLNRKQTLPRFPKAVGLVTSQTGAAIRDLIWGFKERYSPVELILFPVSVQGDNASDEISRAIEVFNDEDLVDIIIIGRGGGSIEDLWAFNEEKTVRAVVSSRIPVVSAVGHEVDVTLCDLAADVRAPTPTAAATFAVPDASELRVDINSKANLMNRYLIRQLEKYRDDLSTIKEGYGFKRVFTRVSDERMRLSELEHRLSFTIRSLLDTRKVSIRSVEKQLRALSPAHILKRGYSIVKDRKGRIIKSSEDILIDSEVNLEFHRGSATAVISELDHG